MNSSKFVLSFCWQVRRRPLAIVVFLLVIWFLFYGGVRALGSEIDSAFREAAISVYLPLIEKRYSISVSGSVVSAGVPIPGAVVRQQTTDNATVTDLDGHFTLSGLTFSQPVTLTAWAPGYYIAGGEAYFPGDENIVLTLTAHTTEDNPGYQWLSAYAAGGESGNCENCHADGSGVLPFDEWQLDAHSQSVTNLRFLTMYNGTDVNGNQSPPTRYTCTPDYGCFPLPPNPTQPYYGPGYKLDFPETAGNCAACHAPAAAIDLPYDTDPSSVTGVGIEGATCDFCHKIWDVKLDSATGLPFLNMPGVLSFEYRRPDEGHQFFAGPFDDVAPGEDTYSPLQNQSQFCAPCHFGVFWDVPIYNSFGEWLESPYSDPQDGQTCQDCHMPPGIADRFARQDRGGLLRDPEMIFSHRMPGALDQQLLQNALSLQTEAVRQNGQVRVTVTVENDQTGHHVPTDSPLRHLILVVSVTDELGNPLVLETGPTLPEWCGVGEPSQGYYAGLPGRAYAKVLQEMWTNISPTGAYWNHTRLVSDNRIPALGSDVTTYVFTDFPDDMIQVKVSLFYRRAFITLMKQKGWEMADILMEATEISLPGSP